MTPDDTPISRFDPVARAARRGLDDLARAPGELSWEAVQSGVRRVYRRRITAIGSACAVLLLGTGGAVAATGNNDGSHRGVSAASASTTTTEATTTPTAATTAVAPPTTTSPPDGVVAPTTTVVPGTQPVQPGDLVGTLTASSNSVQINESFGVTLTLRNVSDHPVSMMDLPASDPRIAFRVRSRDLRHAFALSSLTVDVIEFAPGEERAFSATGYISDPLMIGAAFLEVRDENIDHRILSAVAPLAIDIVPPGWTVGQPLDPSQGRWKVEMSADPSSGMPWGDFTAMVHATVRNVGDQPQRTAAFGSLAIACYTDIDFRSLTYHIVDAMTLGPNAAATFSYEFRADSSHLTSGGMTCSVGILFASGSSNSWAWDTHYNHVGLDSDSVFIFPPDTSATTVPTTTP